MSIPVPVPLRRMSAVALAVALAMPSATLRAAPLTPKAAFDLALRQTPELVRSRAQVAEAKGHLLPSLDLNVTASTSNDPLNVFGMKLQQRQATFNDFGAGQFLAGVDNPDIVNEEVHNLNYPGWYQNFQTELQLQVPIYNGGQVWGGVHRAEAMLAAARHGERLAQQKILFEVIRLFEGIRTAEGYRKAAAQGVEAATSYVKLIEKLHTHGVVAETDVLQARVHLGDARLTEARGTETAGGGHGGVAGAHRHG
jgi:outer membrane protein